MPKIDVTKEEILAQLKKNGVTDLEGFADFVVNKSKAAPEAGKPVVASFVLVDHGLVSH